MASNLKFSKKVLYKILALVFTVLMSSFWAEDVYLHAFDTDFSGVVFLFFLSFAVFSSLIIIFQKKEETYKLSVFLVFALFSSLLLVFGEYVLIGVVFLSVVSAITAALFYLVGVRRIVKIIRWIIYFSGVPFIISIMFKILELLNDERLSFDGSVLGEILNSIYIFSTLYVQIVSIFIPLFVLYFIEEENKNWKKFATIIAVALVAIFLSSNYVAYAIKKIIDPCYTFIEGKGSSWNVSGERACISDDQYMKTFKGADLKSFKEYGGDYYGDKYHIYYHTEIMTVADPATFQVFDNGDLYAKDKKHVFYKKM